MVDLRTKKIKSAKRLKSKYRWLEDFSLDDLIFRVQKSNISTVARELGCPHYVLRGHLERNGFVQDSFKRPEGAWNRGLNKNTDTRIDKGAKNLSNKRKQLFKEHKLSRPDSYMTTDQILARHKKSEETRFKKYGNKFGSGAGWNKGLTKATSDSIRIAAVKQSVTRRLKIKTGEIDKWVFIRASKYDSTSIEIAIQEELYKRKLAFDSQVVLFDKFLVDFVNNNAKVVIFCDGCYWHGCKQHKKNEFKRASKRRAIDKSQTKYLTKAGYKVFRFWEHDIKKDVSACVDKIEHHLRETK